MNTFCNTTRSMQLLDKVYDHLDSIDVSKLSMDEMKDFLEVVQKGRFLETTGQGFPYGFGGFGGCAPFNGPEKPADSKTTNAGTVDVTTDAI